MGKHQREMWPADLDDDEVSEDQQAKTKLVEARTSLTNLGEGMSNLIHEGGCRRSR